MAIRGVTYNDDATPGERTPLLFRNDMDVRYATMASENLTDATEVGLDLLTAADEATARAVIGVTYGDEAGTVVEGDDARLSDERTPLDNSVTAAKMADDAVGIAELSATGTPTATTFLRGDNTWADGTTAVGAGAVGPTELADDAVTAAKLADNAVVNANVAAGAAIALSKLATGVVAGSANGTPTNLTLWKGTQTEYDAIVTKDGNTVYVVLEG